MKKKLMLFLMLILNVIIITVNVNAEESNNKEYVLKQWATNLYYNTEGKLVGTKNSVLDPYKVVLTADNPDWQAYTDEELQNQEMNWVLKNSTYTYWGYSIKFKDETSEFFTNREISLASLKELELNRKKEIKIVDVLYGDTGAITINYFLVKDDGEKELLKTDQTYGLFEASLPGRVELTGESAQMDPIVNNYVIVSKDAEEPFNYEEDKIKTINIYLRNPQYTIHFEDESGTKIRDSARFSAKVGETFKYLAPKIQGYEVKKNATISEIYQNSDREFTIVYARENEQTKAGKVIVRYEDEKGNELQKATTINGVLNQSYQTKPKDIAGFSMVKVNGKEKGVFSTLDQVVTYVYKKIETPVKIGKVMIHYEDENGKILSPIKTLTGRIGDTYKTSTKEIEGYTQISVKGKENGTFAKTDTHVTYIYERIINPVKQGKVTIHYLDEFGKKIHDSKTLTGKIGEMYQTSPKFINQYSLIEIKGEEKGIFERDEKNVTYIYQKNETPTKLGVVTIYYKDETGREINKVKVLTGKIGDIYQTKAAWVNGYILKEIQGNENGKYKDENATVTYVYRLKNDSSESENIQEKNTLKLVNKKKKQTKKTYQKLPQTGENSLEQSILLMIGASIIGTALLYHKLKD